MEAYLIDQFKTLWDEVKVMVDFETKRLVGMHDQNIVKKLNGYYLYEVRHGLWLSESFPNKYNAWYCRSRGSRPCSCGGSPEDFDEE